MNITDKLAVALRALRHHSTQQELYAAHITADEALNEYDSRKLRIAQGVPRYIVDGHEFENEDSALQADGQHPPFHVFDVDTQRTNPIGFERREKAQVYADYLNELNPV